MMYDIAAIQKLYGADFGTNSGDTVYTWSSSTGQEFINGVGQGAPVGNKIFSTVWDGGGQDTYDFSNYSTNLYVDLQPGHFSTVSATQLANLGNGHFAAGNIANALLYSNNAASLIENAIGGTGNDTIIGNDANNRLTGGGGNDNLNGGNGIDTAIYSGRSTDYQIVHNQDGTWSVTDLRAGAPDGHDTLSNIEQLQFSDKLVSIDSLGTTPSLQVPTVATFSNDSGSVGDGITNDNTLVLTGVATAGSSVRVYDGATLLGNVTADTNGAWIFTTAKLVDGAHSFTATASDTSGVTTAASPVLAVTVDTVAPTTPSISSVSPDSGVVGDHITNANTLTLQGSAEAGSTVYVYDGATLLGTATAGNNGAWSYTTLNPGNIIPAFTDPDDVASPTNVGAEQGDSPHDGAVTAALSDGNHSFTVVAKDAAGNTSTTSAATVITIDTAAPVALTIVTARPTAVWSMTA